MDKKEVIMLVDGIPDLDDTDIIRPCPFCGSTDIELQIKYSEEKTFFSRISNEKSWSASVSCQSCYATVYTLSTHDPLNIKKYALEKWNSRA